MIPINSFRRRLTQTLLTLPVWTLFGRHAVASMPTPRTTEGPFYPTQAMRYPDVDNNLVFRRDILANAGGEVLQLSGTVTDRAGIRQHNARVEIWQCDVNGRYLHHGDDQRGARDSGFQGFGQTTTDEQGQFQFTTIVPVSYPGRTPHIHVKVITATHVLTTQLFIEGHPQNQRDSVYRRIAAHRRDALNMRLQANGESLRAQVAFVV